jgi:hypothetical protein
MTMLGTKWCNPNQTFVFTDETTVWYYDGARVYFQLADYTGNRALYEPCALNIARQYRDYVIATNGGIAGWRVHPHGLRMAYERTGDPSYRAALIVLTTKTTDAFYGGNIWPDLMRETAYILSSFVEAERAGEPRHRLLTQTAGFLLGQLQWIAWENYSGMRQLWMFGLAAEALIDYYGLTGDPRVPPVIKAILDWTWTRGWNGTQLLINPDPPGPTCLWGCQEYNSNLINLVAPAYAWYYRVTRNSLYQVRGDEMFAHALDEDISFSGKIFSQNYRWSPDYVRWRTQ